MENRNVEAALESVREIQRRINEIQRHANWVMLAVLRATFHLGEALAQEKGEQSELQHARLMLSMRLDAPRADQVPLPTRLLTWQ